MTEVLIAALPLLLLLGALLFGHYPGCDAIVRLSERIASPRRTAASSSSRPRRPLPPRSFAASGGLLLAFGLSGRAPPA
jgi:hypothetical protein